MGERRGKLPVTQFIRCRRLGFLTGATGCGMAIAIGTTSMFPARHADLSMRSTIGVEDQEARGQGLGLFREMLRRLLDDFLLLRLQRFKSRLESAEPGFILVIDLLGRRLQLLSTSGDLRELAAPLLVKFALRRVHGA